MDWHERIYANPEILNGKPIVRGTLLSVESVLGLFANGWTEEQVLENYLRLTPEDLRALFAFAAEFVGNRCLLPAST